MKKVFDILKFSALFIWQLPQNIVAMIMYPFMGKKTLVKEENGTKAFCATNMSGGISLGNFIYLSKYSASRKETIAHEFGHCKQSIILGWLYLFVIGIPSLCWAAFKPKDKCYYSFYTERWANKNAGLRVSKNQYGCYIFFPVARKEKKKETVKRNSLSDKINRISKMK